MVGSLLVTAIQTIVSREVDPAHPSGDLRRKFPCNVIADVAVLEGTIRALDDAVRTHLQEASLR